MLCCWVIYRPWISSVPFTLPSVPATVEHANCCSSTMSKYFQSPCSPQHSFIQNKLIMAINDPTFKFELPKLLQTTWERVLQPSRFDDDERERLEFLGDAIMHVCVALELYKLFPLGTPHLYTVRFFVLLIHNICIRHLLGSTCSS